MTIKGVLFDKDGTLLDFDATWLPAIRAAALATARGDAALGEHLLRVGGYDSELKRLAPNAVLAAGTTREIAAAWLDHLSGWSADELTALMDRVFEAASEASDETLQAMWARLLANAMDPDHDATLQRVFVDTLKGFEPIDARVLDWIVQERSASEVATGHLNEALEIRLSLADVCLLRLLDLRCLREAPKHRFHYYVTGLGVELVQACRDDGED